jgi:integrase/recombinase XerD
MLGRLHSVALPLARGRFLPTCSAIRLLRAGVDTSVIALWLGHESPETTQMYVHADLSLKERAIKHATPLNTKPGRYRPPDKLPAFLETL